jgi:hypothetical protein
LREERASAKRGELAKLGGQTIGKDSVTRDFGSYHMSLLVVPWSKESFEILTILNYYSFPCLLEEDMRGYYRKEHGFEPTDEYPMLVIDSSEPGIPSADLVGRDHIVSFLY